MKRKLQIIIGLSSVLAFSVLATIMGVIGAAAAEPTIIRGGSDISATNNPPSQGRIR